MMDWPNLLAGFVLGVATSLFFFWLDRRQDHKKDMQAVRDDWIAAAAELELLAWQPDTNLATFHAAVVKHPVDRWRRVLGSDDILNALERLESAYASVSVTSLHADTDDGMKRFASASNELHAARVGFAGLVREYRSEENDSIVRAQLRRQLRREYLRHPIKTWKRERYNRKVRAEA